MIRECPNCGKGVLFPRKIFLHGDVPFDKEGVFYPIEDVWIYFLFECVCGAAWAVIDELP